MDISLCTLPTSIPPPLQPQHRFSIFLTSDITHQHLSTRLSLPFQIGSSPRAGIGLYSSLCPSSACSDDPLFCVEQINSACPQGSPPLLCRFFFFFVFSYVYIYLRNFILKSYRSTKIIFLFFSNSASVKVLALGKSRKYPRKMLS